MVSNDYLHVMAEYNSWMNRRLYEIIGEFSEADRTADRGAFFGSLHNTLDHILFGDRAGLARLTGAEIPAFPGRTAAYPEFAELRRERESTDAALLDFARSVDIQRLRAPITFYSKVYQRERTVPLWTLAVHLFNHQTHHRGQVTDMLTRMGVDYGSADLPWTPIFD